jgi:hypothetical protein
MELTLIDQELCESRLYRTSRALSNLNGRDVADLVYLNTLSLYLMLQDDVQHDYATAYADKTAQYGGFHSFRSNATDLYLLCFVLTNPENKYIRLADHNQSVQFIKRLSFDPVKHLHFLRSISNNNVNYAVSYFMRLESQLNIRESRFKQYRRLLTDWSNLKYSNRQITVSRLMQDIRRIAKGSELSNVLATMAKYRSFSVEPEYQEPKPSLGTKIAGAVVGAAAGRYAAGKVSSMKPDTVKKLGTGLGAIAGYWTAGRRRKQI